MAHPRETLAELQRAALMHGAASLAVQEPEPYRGPVPNTPPGGFGDTEPTNAPPVMPDQGVAPMRGPAGPNMVGGVPAPAGYTADMADGHLWQNILAKGDGSVPSPAFDNKPNPFTTEDPNNPGDFLGGQAPGYKGPIPGTPPGGWGQQKPNPGTPASAPMARAPQSPGAATPTPRDQEGGTDWGGKVGNILELLGPLAGNAYAAKEMQRNAHKPMPGDASPLLQGVQENNQLLQHTIARQHRETANSRAMAMELRDKTRAEGFQNEDRANAATDRERKMRHEDIAARLSAEARDPSSQKNAIFRQSIQKEYPEAWAALTPEQQKSFTIEEAHALTPAMEAEQGRKAATAKGASEGAARVNKLTDEKELAKYKSDLSIAAKRGKGTGTGGGGAPVKDEGSLAALEAAYGGAEKVPPAVRQRMKLALAAGGPKGRAAVLSALKDAEAETGKRADAKDKADAKDADVALAERKAYEKSSEPARDSQDAIAAVDAAVRELAPGGIDNMDKNLDLPGYGRLASYAPDWAISDKGQHLRAKATRPIAEAVRAMTGLASSEKEREVLQKMSGGGKGMNEAELLDGLRQMRSIAERHGREAAANYPKAAAAFEKNMQGGTPAPQQGGGGIGAPAQTKTGGGFTDVKPVNVRLKNPETGEVVAFTEEEAKLFPEWSRVQ